MSSKESPNQDLDLVRKVKAGDQQAWKELIETYEGRLLAYIDCRINDRSTSEDIVQDAFIGFLNSLPNYDEDRPLESYLFAICGYKLTDYLRREGRRPVLQLRRNTNQENQDQAWIGPHRVASSIVRSAEQKQIEEQVIQTAISEQIEHWKRTDQWTKLKVIEMIYVKGSGNKQVAELLAISEQQVANYKSDFQMKLRSIIQRMNLEQHVFPELYETPAPEQ